MKLDYSSLRPCDQAPLIVAKRERFPDATCLRFCNGKVENYAETPNYYLDCPNQSEWTHTNSRVFVFSDIMDEWFELEYDAHFNRRRQEDAPFKKTTAAFDDLCLHYCSQAPLIAAKKNIFPDATGLRFVAGNAVEYTVVPKYYMNHPNVQAWAREDSRIFIFEESLAEWFELEYDEHYDRRQHPYQDNKVPTTLPASSAPSAPVPWWNRHYTLPTDGLKSTCFAVEHVTPDNCRVEYGRLWHEHNAVIDTQRQHDLIALRRFIRGAICGQEGTE